MKTAAASAAAGTMVLGRRCTGKKYSDRYVIASTMVQPETAGCLCKAALQENPEPNFL
jgi:hypothetical protein